MPYWLVKKLPTRQENELFHEKSAFLQKKLILWRILGCWKNLRNDSRMSSWAQISVFGPGKHFRTDLVSSKNIIDLFSSNWKNHAKTHFLRAITSFSMIMSPSDIFFRVCKISLTVTIQFVPRMLARLKFELIEAEAVLIVTLFVSPLVLLV